MTGRPIEPRDQEHQQRADLRDIDAPPEKTPPEGLVRPRKGPLNKSGRPDEQVPAHVPPGPRSEE
jgi:hypothetical protein